MSKILYVSSEAFPLVKTGGLADVAGSLPPALLKKSQDVRLLLPAYPEVLNKIRHRKVRSASSYYNLDLEIIETRLPGSKVIVWLVDCPALFDRPGGPYADEHGKEWQDNALRFAVFCQAAVDISLNKLQLDWQPDVVHCNDWQTGLVPALLSLQAERPVTVSEGTNIIVGNSSSRIVEEAEKILEREGKKGGKPELWDGNASERVVEILKKKMGRI